MTKEVLYFRVEPRGSLYKDLVEWLIPRSDRFCLILRNSLSPAEVVSEALERLRPWRVSVEEVSAWPGTRLLGSATQYTHECSPSPADTLLELSGGLFDWIEPFLPEDLCFLTSSRHPLLVTIAHEREAYLDLTSAEEADLRANAPDVHALLERQALPDGW